LPVLTGGRKGSMELIRKDGQVEMRQIDGHYHVVRADYRANQVMAVDACRDGSRLFSSPVWSESATRYVSRPMSRVTAVALYCDATGDTP